jgi:hypothetical protein
MFNKYDFSGIPGDEYIVTNAIRLLLQIIKYKSELAKIGKQPYDQDLNNLTKLSLLIIHILSSEENWDIIIIRKLFKCIVCFFSRSRTENDLNSRLIYY